MKFLYLLLSLAGATQLAADGPEYLAIGRPHRLIGDKVRVRSKPDTKAETIAELAIGTEVNPTEQTTVMYKHDGIEAPWYKVKFSNGGKSTEGFVWGNLIAKGFGVSAEGLVFMYGTGHGKQEADGYTNFTTQIRVAKDGKELARLEIKGGVGFQSQEKVVLAGNRGFAGIKNIFSVAFVQEYCAGKGNTMFFFWDGQQIHHVHSSVDGADAPVYAIETQTFPDQKGGKADHLYIVRENGDHDNPKSKKIEKFWLKWNGKKFIKAS